MDEIFIATAKGYVNRFSLSSVRVSAKGSRGTRGIRLRNEDKVIGAIVKYPSPKSYALIITKNGFGKRTLLHSYKMGRCGSSGSRGIKLRANDTVAKICYAEDGYDLIAMTAKGLRIQTPTKDIPELSPNTKGVRLIKLNAGDRVTTADTFNPKLYGTKTIEVKEAEL